jgi:hypothetical protein
MSRQSFKVKTTGTFFGVKVNSTGTAFASAMKRASMSRGQLLNKLRPMFKKRLENRIPKLIEQLQNGVQGRIGSIAFELRSNTSGHKPHKHIPNPLTRIIKDGTRYKVLGKKDRIQVDIKLKNNRSRSINFHNKMKKTPKISTVALRLDATCLPFYKDGHHIDIYEYWLDWSRMGLYKVLEDFMRGEDTSSKERL